MAEEGGGGEGGGEKARVRSAPFGSDNKIGKTGEIQQHLACDGFSGGGSASSDSWAAVSRWSTAVGAAPPPQQYHSVKLE